MIQASEKLIANFERGRARVILGARSVENARIDKKPKPYASEGSQ
jgi:hypothetical protein